MVYPKLCFPNSLMLIYMCDWEEWETLALGVFIPLDQVTLDSFGNDNHFSLPNRPLV